MGRLDHVTLAELHEQLDRTEGNVPTQRVLAAIGRKQGAPLEELAERHNVSEKTIRNWLDRFADRPLADAPYDEDRSGRPTKLTEDAKDNFIIDLDRPPEELGYDRPAWNPELARRHLSENYGVEYSLRHVYRLLEEAALPSEPNGPTQYQTGPTDDTSR